MLPYPQILSAKSFHLHHPLSFYSAQGNTYDIQAVEVCLPCRWKKDFHAGGSVPSRRMEMGLPSAWKFDFQHLVIFWNFGQILLYTIFIRMHNDKKENMHTASFSINTAILWMPGLGQDTKKVGLSNAGPTFFVSIIL